MSRSLAHIQRLLGWRVAVRWRWSPPTPATLALDDRLFVRTAWPSVSVGEAALRG